MFSFFQFVCFPFFPSSSCIICYCVSAQECGSLTFFFCCLIIKKKKRPFCIIYVVWAVRLFASLDYSRESIHFFFFFKTLALLSDVAIKNLSVYVTIEIAISDIFILTKKKKKSFVYCLSPRTKTNSIIKKNYAFFTLFNNDESFYLAYTYLTILIAHTANNNDEQGLPKQTAGIQTSTPEFPIERMEEEERNDSAHMQDIHSIEKEALATSENIEAKMLEETSTPLTDRDRQQSIDKDIDEMDASDLFFENKESSESQLLLADHPLLKRAQETLKEQLLRMNERLNGQVVEKEEDLVRIEKQREDLGVELYNRQQELAKSQIQLQSYLEQFETLQIQRQKSESGLNNLKNEMEELAQIEIQQKKKLSQSQKDLQILKEDLRR
ncbi:hypothetical protein RFI_11849, partial [Reticulomyxa filosa]